jgi:hypothetical protein
LEDSFTKSNEGSGMNPDFEYEKQFSFTPCTKQVGMKCLCFYKPIFVLQFVDYLSEGMLVIEVWGRQADNDAGADLSTAELMLKDKSKGPSTRVTVVCHRYNIIVSFFSLL